MKIKVELTIEVDDIGHDIEQTLDTAFENMLDADYIQGYTWKEIK